MKGDAVSHWYVVSIYKMLKDGERWMNKGAFKSVTKATAHADQFARAGFRVRVEKDGLIVATNL